MLDLTGKKILVTQANDFMGPALCEALRQCGAEVIADSRLPIAPSDAQEMINTEYGDIDFNRAEDARQCLNRAKWILFEYVMKDGE